MKVRLKCSCGYEGWSVYKDGLQCRYCQSKFNFTQEYLGLDDEENTFSLDVDLIQEELKRLNEEE